ncbi:unnamed protein product [Aphanomyces euteiches]
MPCPIAGSAHSTATAERAKLMNAETKFTPGVFVSVMEANANAKCHSAAPTSALAPFAPNTVVKRTNDIAKSKDATNKRIFKANAYDMAVAACVKLKAAQRTLAMAHFENVTKIQTA